MKSISPSVWLLARIFLSGAVIVGLGFYAQGDLDKKQAMGFLLGALTLGGGFIICGLFALRSKWHGIIGAGVLSLLGVARGLGNLPGAAHYLVGTSRDNGPLPIYELSVTLICLLLLVKAVQAVMMERTRRVLEAEP